MMIIGLDSHAEWTNEAYKDSVQKRRKANVKNLCTP